MASSDLRNRVAKRLWEEAHWAGRPWLNKHDGDRGKTDHYLRLAEIAIEEVERARGSS